MKRSKAAPFTFDTGDRGIAVAWVALIADAEGSTVDSGGSATDVAAKTDSAFAKKRKFLRDGIIQLTNSVYYWTHRSSSAETHRSMLLYTTPTLGDILDQLSSCSWPQLAGEHSHAGTCGGESFLEN
jgi:hypothetical protein